MLQVSVSPVYILKVLHMTRSPTACRPLRFLPRKIKTLIHCPDRTPWSSIPKVTRQNPNWGLKEAASFRQKKTERDGHHKAPWNVPCNRVENAKATYAG